MIELDMFDKNQLETVLRAMRIVKESSERVRKGTYAKIGELEKKVETIEEKIKKISGEN